MWKFDFNYCRHLAPIAKPREKKQQPWIWSSHSEWICFLNDVLIFTETSSSLCKATDRWVRRISCIPDSSCRRTICTACIGSKEQKTMLQKMRKILCSNKSQFYCSNWIREMKFATKLCQSAHCRLRYNMNKLNASFVLFTIILLVILRVYNCLLYQMVL